MFYTYIAQSIKNRNYYIGSTKNLNERLKRHNAGLTKSIKHNGPYSIVYFETYKTRIEAYRREKQIKSYKGGQAFKTLIKT